MNFKAVDFPAVKGKSNITTLVFDEADLAISDAIQALSVPKALETFRWQQEIACYSIGTCYGPFYKSLGQALLQHKNTLRELELDIRHKYCREAGHAANPYGTTEQRRGFYRNSDDIKRDPNEDILIGSLRDFTVLKQLSIHAEALCGHKDWCPATIRMINALPSSLETLRILINKDEQEDDYQNKYLEEHALKLMQGYKDNLPNLREFEIKICVPRLPPWAPAGPLVDPRYSSEQILSSEASDVGLDFIINSEMKSVETRIPFFGEQTVDRNPGRDY